MRSLVLFCLFIRVAGADSLDICSCPEMSGQISCTSHRSVSLLRTCAREAQVLRVQGDGFVAEVNFNDDKFREVLLEKTTLTCMEGWVHFPNATRLVFNGVTCRRANRTTSKPTTTTKVIITYGPHLLQKRVSKCRHTSDQFDTRCNCLNQLIITRPYRGLIYLNRIILDYI